MLHEHSPETWFVAFGLEGVIRRTINEGPVSRGKQTSGKSAEPNNCLYAMMAIQTEITIFSTLPPGHITLHKPLI